MFKNFKDIFNEVAFNFSKRDPELVNPSSNILNIVRLIEQEYNNLQQTDISYYIFKFYFFLFIYFHFSILLFKLLL